jgi:hypothetical protein
MSKLSVCAERVGDLVRRLDDEPEFSELLAQQPPPFHPGSPKIW